jgi:lysozyme family protein
MADFGLAFWYLLGNEEYAPTDPRYGKVRTDNDGGLVRFGVNSNSLGKYLSQVDSTYYSTMVNADAIKVSQFLYNKYVWKPMHGDDITSQRVGSKLLDMGVNQGLVEASKLCQRAVSVNVDGNIGPITIAAINAMDETDMLKGLVYWWLWFIQQVITNHPEDKSYEVAWTARAEKLPAA